MSAQKEIRYFNKRHHLHNVINENHLKPFSWYVSRFQHCHPNKTKGEFSPSYLCDETAPVLIRKHFPEVRLIASLRNPIDRAYSAYLMRKFRGVESRSFEDAITDRSDSIENGFYSRQLKRYFRLFARDQILITFFDEIAVDPAKVLKQVFGFLSIDPNISIAPDLLLKKASVAKRIRSEPDSDQAASPQIVNPKLELLWSALRKIGLGKKPERAVEAWNYPPMNPQTRERLLEIYKDDIQELEQLLSCDLSHWR